MSRKFTSELTRMGRRRYLQTLVGAGVSATTAANLTPEKLAELTNDPTEEIPRLAGHETIYEDEKDEPTYEPRYYTISPEKYVRVEASWNAANKIRKEVQETDESGQVGVGVSSRTNGHHSEKVIRVIKEVDEPSIASKAETSAEDLEDELPSQITGEVPASNDVTTASAGANDLTNERIEDIPVVVEEMTESTSSCDDDGVATSRERPVTGGMAINSGTTGFELFDHSQGHPVIVTHAHGWVDEDDGETTSDAVGDSVHQPSDDWWRSTKIGEIEKASWHETDFGVSFSMDAATVRMTDADSADYIADSDDPEAEFVNGRFALETLKDMEDDGDTLTRQGKTTGRCTGSFELVEQSGAWETVIDTDSDDGDSGGPHYGNPPDFDDLHFAAGIHRATRNDEYAVGVFIEDIREELDLTL